MRKMLMGSIGVCLVVILGALVAGCGQSTPSITTTNSQPSGLKIKGTVYTQTIVTYAAGLPRGVVASSTSSNRGAPVQGAVVALSGDSTRETSVTNAQGEYLFSGIPDGDYYLIVTAEGHQRSSSTWVVIKSAVVPADNTITVTDIVLKSEPIVTSYSPQAFSVISKAPTFVVTFDEAMDQSTVLPTLTPGGVRTYANSGNSVSILTSWADAKTLVITPEAALIVNDKYWLDVDPDYTAKDLAGNRLTTSGELALPEYAVYRVTSEGVPSAPANVQVSVGTRAMISDPTTGADFADIYNTVPANVTVGLNWSPSTGAITGYKVYLANSATGNYHLIEDVSAAANYVDVTMDDILNALYGTTSITPIGTGNYPLINIPLYVKVVAYNGDGESAAGAVTAIHLVGPRIDTTTYKKYGYAGGMMTEGNVTLPSIDVANKKVVYIGLSEPIGTSTPTFSLTAGGGTAIVSATLLGNSNAALTTFGGGTDVYAIVKIETQDDMNALTQFTMSTSVTDLSGNPVKAATYDTITLGGF